MNTRANLGGGRLVTRRIALAASVACVILAPQLSAQGRTSLVVAPTYQSWQFADSVPLDTINVKSATQISVPFLLGIPLGSRWRVTANGAVFSSQLTTDDASSATPRELTGISDLRIRATGNLIGDNLQLTIGVNVPTGPVGLSPAQNDVLSVVAAPALGALVSVPGLGFGGTIGAIASRSAGQWSLAFGGAYEQRGTYSPVEAVIAGVDKSTELVPGGTIHLSFGADGLIGANRLSFGVVGDVYSTDKIRATSGGVSSDLDEYKLGPTGTVTVALQIASSRIRDFKLQLTDLYRSQFTDATGKAVEGSSGNYLEMAGSGLIGAPGRVALILGLDARLHSGLPVDNSFIGAELTAGGATIGLSIPSGKMEWRPTVRYSQGTLTTQLVSTSMTSITAGLTLSAR